MQSKKVSFRESPVLEAAFCLNPYYLSDSCNLLLRNKLKEYVKLAFGDDLYTGDVLSQFSRYKSRGVPELNDECCLLDAKKLPALGWWKNWGYPFPELQQVACRVCGLGQGNGPSERDWSNRTVTKTKIRNKMGGPTHDNLHNVREFLKDQVTKLRPTVGCRMVNNEQF